MIKPNTSFKAVCAFGIYPENVKVLSLLYQPLIGSQALGLYLMLASLNGELTHHFLMQLQNLSVDQFLQCRHKLEGVGLLGTFKNQENQLTYELKKPLDPAQFFSDGIINAFLCLKIGNTDYQNLKRLFISAPLEDKGEHIGKSFNEVFDTATLMSSNVMIGISPLPATGQAAGITLQLGFDRDLLGAILKNQGMDESLLSEKLLEQLNKLSFLYKLEESDLARFIVDGLDPDGFVNMDKVRQTARQYWQFINKGKPLGIVEVDANFVPETENRPANQSKEERLLSFYEQTPLEFLKHKSNDATPVPADRKLVEWLYVDQGMSHGVVNVLIDYVLKVSDGRLPKALVEKIAGEWQRKSIDTTEKAINQVKLVLRGNKERAQKQQMPAATRFAVGGRPIRQEPVPTWLGQVAIEEKTTADQQRIEQMKQLQQEVLHGKR